MMYNNYLPPGYTNVFSNPGGILLKKVLHNRFTMYAAGVYN